MANIAGARRRGRGDDLKGALQVLFQFQTRFPADDVQPSVRPTGRPAGPDQTRAEQSRAELVYRSRLVARPFRVPPERSLQPSAAL